MKVKTFVSGLEDGYLAALERLDERVLELGDVEIIDVDDTLYPVLQSPRICDVAKLARRILYQERSKH